MELQPLEASGLGPPSSISTTYRRRALHMWPVRLSTSDDMGRRGGKGPWKHLVAAAITASCSVVAFRSRFSCTLRGKIYKKEFLCVVAVVHTAINTTGGLKNGC